MTDITFALPYPPSANKIWRSPIGAESPIKSREYRAWLKAAESAIPVGARGRIRGAHELEIVVDRPDRRARDLDNLLKPVLDAIKESPASLLKGVIRDDADTRRIVLSWRSDDPTAVPVVTVTARAL